MIQSVSASSLMGFGAFTCPQCGKDGLASRHMPCPACGGDVTVVRKAGVAGGLDVMTAERGETGRSLADTLKEKERERLQPEHERSQNENSQDESPTHWSADARAAATAVEAGVPLEGSRSSTAPIEQTSREDGTSSTKTAAVSSQVADISAAPRSGMNAQELSALREMQQRDREVRSHEQAHIAAGGNVVTGGASYTFDTGPDGRQYATGGEVQIDASPVPGDPEATIEKAQTIRRAALAPASPSAQDQKVAAQAAQMEAEAHMDKLEERRQEQPSPPFEARDAAAAFPSVDENRPTSELPRLKSPLQKNGVGQEDPDSPPETLAALSLSLHPEPGALAYATGQHETAPTRENASALWSSKKVHERYAAMQQQEVVQQHAALPSQQKSLDAII